MSENASLENEHGPSSNNSQPNPRVNGTYANFTTYNHARSSTVVSPENGKLNFDGSD
jgi:hypothetical protein